MTGESWTLGQVGIGTETPAYKLHLIDNATGWSSRIHNNSGGAAKSDVYMGNGSGSGMHLRAL